MKKLRLLQNIAFILLISGGLIYADPQVMSVTMNPTNPGWGQPFQVTVQYCADQYNTDFLAMAVSSNNTFQVTGSGNQEFLVSSSGINTETTSPTGNIGITLSPPAYTGNCTLCTGNGNGGTGSTVTEIYNLTMI